jgi:hypothetical protein
MKLFKWHLPGTRHKGVKISALEAQTADLRRAMAEARAELRQETLKLTEQVDDLGTDLDEARGDPEPQAARGPLALPTSVGRNPAALPTGLVNAPHERPKDPTVAWKARWPNHCKACGGWGVFQRADHDPPDSGEIPLKLCDALPPGACHRCGAPGGIDLQNRLSRGCRECGWEFDDGVPEPGGPGKGL